MEYSCRTGIGEHYHNHQHKQKEFWIEFIVSNEEVEKTGTMGEETMESVDGVSMEPGEVDGMKSSEVETMESREDAAVESMETTMKPIDPETKSPSPATRGNTFATTQLVNPSSQDESRIYVNEVMEKYHIPSFTSSVSWDNLSSKYK